MIYLKERWSRPSACELVFQHAAKRGAAARLLTLVSISLLALTLPAQQPENLAPYLPTPETIVKQMLDYGQLKPGEKMFDLGSGDGRIVLMAARQYGADATGVELDDELYLESQNKIRQLGLMKTARIIHGDLLAQDYSQANLITIYLWPEANIKVRAVLDRQLKKGTRIVAHDFEIGGWTPARTITIPDDGAGRSHTLFLYIK